MSVHNIEVSQDVDLRGKCDFLQLSPVILLTLEKTSTVFEKDINYADVNIGELRNFTYNVKYEYFDNE